VTVPMYTVPLKTCLDKKVLNQTELTACAKEEATGLEDSLSKALAIESSYWGSAPVNWVC
jgi:hypothetical protein